MPKIIPTTYLLCFSAVAVAVVLSLSLAVVAATEEESHILRLPSEAAVSGDGVCTSKAAAAACPVKCFRTDPVCGMDGVTYWCGCAEAECAGAKVAKLGFCELGSGGSAPISAQALLLVHIVWLIVLGFSVLFGLF
ncbi:serine protease inhibitor, Kazal-type family protein [Senna tora]|uniref:Serine protease inhibitor, Kazal-type family protein n=1 Tax=Senna tora TaxID=362788 RepID=A0A834WBQ8_9FABA|nr:serine protease inhibitor, Kazal-type family protein [Senna tora]